MSRYRVAVRTLCDFTARQGDLDHRFTPAPSAQEGIEGHALVAKRRENIAGYLAELPLSGEYQGLRVAGRADGFDVAANCVEEVKTHRSSLARMADNQRALHWAQVKVYGALLCAEREAAARGFHSEKSDAVEPLTGHRREHGKQRAQGFANAGGRLGQQAASSAGGFKHIFGQRPLPWTKVHVGKGQRGEPRIAALTVGGLLLGPG